MYNGLKLGIKKRTHFFGQDIRHYIKGFSSSGLVHSILGKDLNDTHMFMRNLHSLKLVLSSCAILIYGN